MEKLKTRQWEEERKPMRLIDADAYAAEMKTRQDACLELMNAAREMDNEKMYGQKSAAFSVFVEAKLTLDAMPTVDAVPVVRCCECKHRYVDGDNVRYNVCELNHNKVQSDDWFCADGERKDGAV